MSRSYGLLAPATATGRGVATRPGRYTNLTSAGAGAGQAIASTPGGSRDS